MQAQEKKARKKKFDVDKVRQHELNEWESLKRSILTIIQSPYIQWDTLYLMLAVYTVYSEYM